MQRKIALKIIYKTISDASFTNLLMRKELQNIDPLKRAFVTNIVQGVLKNYEFLAYNVSLYAKKTDLLKPAPEAQAPDRPATSSSFFLLHKPAVSLNQFFQCLP